MRMELFSVGFFVALHVFCTFLKITTAKMGRELSEFPLRDLILGSPGIDPSLTSTQPGPGLLCNLGSFQFGRIVGLTCIGLSWGMYLKMLSKKAFDLKDETLTRKMMYKWETDFSLPLISRWLQEEHRNLNHFSRNLVKYGYAPYPLITMYDNRLGESEWYYSEIESPSNTRTWGHVKDVIQEGKDSLEFEFFRKAMRICGRFPKHHLRKMFAHCKIVELEENEVLLGIGDMDETMIVILDGEIKITTVNTTTGITDILRIAKRGDKLVSLLSLIDSLSGHAQPIKTIEAFAIKPSKVLKFPFLVFKNYLLLHKKKIVDTVKRMIRKVHDIHYLLLNKTLGILDSVTPDHLRVTASSKYVKLLPLNPYGLPDPIKDGVSPELREEAIKDFLRFLGIPEDNYSAFVESCPVQLLDPDPRGINVTLPVEHFVINDKSYKFRYLYKGQADIFVVQESIAYQLQHPNKIDPTGSEMYEEDIIGEWEKDCTKFDHSHYAYMNSGEGMGGLAAFSEQGSQLFIKVIQRSIFVMVPEVLFQNILQIFPEICFPIMYQINLRIPPVMRMMDFGIEWTRVPAGICLFATGNEVHDTYLVLSGKLRSYLANSRGRLKFYGDYERNSWIGLIEALVMFPFRSKTVVAAVESEVVRIPMFYINFLTHKFPNAAAALLQNVAGRSESRRHASYQPKTEFKKPKTLSFGKTKFNEVFEGSSRAVSSLALLPLTGSIPVIPFALEIEKHHERHGTTKVLTWELCKSALKIPYINQLNEFGVQTWIMNALNEHALVVLVCCSSSKRWSRMCIQHSELIVSVGVRGHPIGEHWMERKMIREGFGFSQRKELVILHNEFDDRKKDPRDVQGIRLYLPFDSSGWLEERPWVSIHHQLRLPEEAFKPEYLDHPLLEKVRCSYSPLKREIEELSDMSRFNRWLTGKSTGVVFTGGGARFATQVGVLKRFLDEGLAIDMVGGVGTGLIIACLFALYQDIQAVETAVRDIFETLNNVTRRSDINFRRFLFDATIPYISPIQGRSITNLCERYFGLARMEDAWIPIFGITTDIGKQDSRIHRNGPMWIYTRASLANFLFAPPVNDPRDGGFIVDGSFSNPIPEDIMRSFGAEFVLVINTILGVTYETQKLDPTKDIFINAWRLFVMVSSKLNFVTPDFVKINDMIIRTQKVMYAEAVQANTDGLFVAIIRPNVEYHPAHSYNDFDRLYWIGRDYADNILRQLGENTTSPNGHRQFWTRLMFINRAIEKMEGRTLGEASREEFWEKLDSRIFDRDDKLTRATAGEEYVGAFQDAQKGFVAAPHVIHERKEELKKKYALKDFSDWVYTKFMK